MYNTFTFPSAQTISLSATRPWRNSPNINPVFLLTHQCRTSDVKPSVCQNILRLPQ